MEDIGPDIDIEGQTPNSVSNMVEGQGSSDTEEQTANFISEEQTSEWFNKSKSTFERHETREVRSDDLIRKLPACFRVPSEQFTPKLWQFGLHNRDALHPSESEDLKIALAAACKLGSWDAFYVAVVDDPVGVLRTYGLDNYEPKFSMRQVQYLLTLDALTIFLVFAYYTFRDAFGEIMHIGVRLIALLEPTLEYLQLYTDLLLSENQIPIALLRRVISKSYKQLQKPNCKLTEQQLLNTILTSQVVKMCEVSFVWTQDYRARIEDTYAHGKLEECPHIFACIYRVLCGQNWERRSGKTAMDVQSATALKKAGIQIKGIKGGLDKVEFRKRCLFLPIVKLYDHTESAFRNLAMYEISEYLASEKCAFVEYLRLMTGLMKGLEDVQQLIDCGVMQNELCTDNNAFEMWNSLQSRIPLASCSNEYENMVSKINKQCKSTLNVMRIEFYQIFCSRPWYVIGVITATIVTVGTCIQAYTSVIGSDKMQPHFPP